MGDKKAFDSTENRHAYLFMLEVIISIGIFVITTSIIMMLFVKAKRYDIKTENLHEANTFITNLTEEIRLYSDREDMEEGFKEMGFKESKENSYRLKQGKYDYSVDLKKKEGVVVFSISCNVNSKNVLKRDVEHVLGDF